MVFNAFILISFGNTGIFLQYFMEIEYSPLTSNDNWEAEDKE